MTRGSVMQARLRSRFVAPPNASTTTLHALTSLDEWRVGIQRSCDTTTAIVDTRESKFPTDSLRAIAGELCANRHMHRVSTLPGEPHTPRPEVHLLL